MHLKFSSIIKISFNIIIIALLVSAMFIINNLNTVVDNKDYEINGLVHNNENLNLNIIDIKEQNKKLQTENDELNGQIQDLLTQIKNLEGTISQLQANIATLSKKDFKSYLPYTAITNKNSKQWELQQDATTNEDGIRCLNGLPMVAVGTGWGVWVGDTIIVNCANGNSFKAIVGDIKSDRHTDAENKTTVSNGCRCEFLVDLDKLDPYVKLMGNIATMDKYTGYVLSIVPAN